MPGITGCLLPCWHCSEPQRTFLRKRNERGLNGLLGELDRAGSVHLLELALDVVAGGVSAAVSVQGALGVELLEALLVRDDATVAPDLLALEVQDRAVAVVTVPGVVGAGVAVLLVNVRRALARAPGADLLQVALVGRLPADHVARLKL